VPKLRRGSVSDPSGYLVRAVVTTAGTRGRRAAHERRVRERRGGEARGTPAGDEAVVTRLTFIAALDRLSARQRAVVVLRYYEDMTEVQIADALGLSVGSVRAHASRALAALGVMLGVREGSPR
jgi:RNA polymerase sigma factor (sigma-70 family)